MADPVFTYSMCFYIQYRPAMQAARKVFSGPGTTMVMTAATLEQPVADPALDARFRELLERYRAAILRLAASYEHNRADREDLVQDIWLAVWRALSSFRGQCSERTYVYRIAHNRAITRRSRRRPAAEEIEAAQDLPDPAPTAEQATQRADDRERLLAAVRRLPPVQREVVLLVLEGLPQREVADVLGITEANVAVRMSRARAELTRRLGGEP